MSCIPPSSGRPSRPTSHFFVLAFVFTWALQVPGVVAGFAGGLPADSPLLPLAMLGIFGPMVAALVLTARDEGRAGLRRLLAPLLRVRVHPLWYVVALLVPALLLTCVLGALALGGREGPVSYVPPAGRLAVGLVISLAEEIGWRGYAQPRLERRHGVFGAAGIVGVLWGLWHVPMFLATGVPLELFLVLALLFVGGSLFYSWVQRSTGSLLLVVLAHFGAHLNNATLALPGDSLPLVVQAVVFAGLGLLVCWPVRLLPGSPRRGVAWDGSPRGPLTAPTE